MLYENPGKPDPVYIRGYHTVLCMMTSLSDQTSINQSRKEEKMRLILMMQRMGEKQRMKRTSPFFQAWQFMCPVAPWLKETVMTVITQSLFLSRSHSLSSDLFICTH